MNVYFEVGQDSALYRDYFKWLADREKVYEIFQGLREKYGIATKAFYPRKGRFRISPTPDDLKNLNQFLLKSGDGTFRADSPMNREWCGAVKGLSVESIRLFNYFRLLGQHWRELLFHDGDRLYGKVESDGEVECPDYCRQIKASEFYAILEKDEAE